MPFLETLRQYDVGTPIELKLRDDDLPFDLTGCAVQFDFQPPGAEPFARAAVITDTANGIVHYTTRPGDLSRFGLWRIQAHITGAAEDWRSRERRFVVEAIIGPAPIFLTPGVAGMYAHAPHVGV